jgi:hypothetical protein
MDLGIDNRHRGSSSCQASLDIAAGRWATFFAPINGFSARKHYILSPGDIMAAPAETLTSSSTAALIREMAARHQVSYVPTQSDLLANHITRLSRDDVEFDEIEHLLIALQRAGHIARDEVVRLQARYLREIKP